MRYLGKQDHAVLWQQNLYSWFWSVFMVQILSVNLKGGITTGTCQSCPRYVGLNQIVQRANYRCNWRGEGNFSHHLILFFFMYLFTPGA